MKLLFERSVPGRRAALVPELDVPAVAFDESLLREKAPRLPELSEVDLSRHYSELARQTQNPVADLISRTYEVKILVKNPDKVLRPGMVCDVQLDQQGEREMVLIPYQGITVDKNRSPIVFVVDTLSKTVKKRVIQTGQYQNAEIEVRSGLSGGERIVTEGKEKLSDNSLIKY